MNAKILFVHALSPLHAGTGQGVGVIDLPTAREKATGLPFLPGSSLKGVLRDLCADDAKCKKVFGPKENPEEHAGSAQFTDQRLLLMPIRSLAGTFAWVSSPYILRRWLRDATAIGLNSLPLEVPDIAVKSSCAVSSGCELVSRGKVVLEEMDLQPDNNLSNKIDQWAEWLAKQIFAQDSQWQSFLKARLCIVQDDILNFLLNTATEVTARIKIEDETKTVATGQLWYEESLPAETILSGLIVATPVNGTTVEDVFKVIDPLTKQVVQLGGKATVGRGLCHLQLTDREGNSQ